MEFKINGEKADVKLQNEKTAYDITSSFIKQLEDGLVIATIELNGDYISPDDDKLKNININDIKTINFEIATHTELAVNLLEEVKNQMLNIAKDLKKNAYAHSNEINEILDWIVETIEAINKVASFHLTEGTLIMSTIAQIKDYINGDEKDDKKIDSLANIFDNLIEYIVTMQNKIATNFVVKHEDLVKAIATGLDILPEISGDFQLGKDKDALAKIHTIINLLEMCLIYFKQKLSDFPKDTVDEAEQMYNDMNSILSEIVEAFENGDFVLIGDLLEYELPEKLEDFRGMI